MPRRFTIRALLFLTFLVALVLAGPLRSASLQREGREWVAAQRGHFSFQYGLDSANGRYSIPYVPDCFVAWFGVDLFNPVRGVCLDCDTVEDLGPVSKLVGLKALAINIDMADDIDFAPLRELPRLEELHFTKWSGLTRDQFNELSASLPNVEIYSEAHSDG